MFDICGKINKVSKIGRHRKDGENTHPTRKHPKLCILCSYTVPNNIIAVHLVGFLSIIRVLVFLLNTSTLFTIIYTTYLNLNFIA